MTCQRGREGGGARLRAAEGCWPWLARVASGGRPGQRRWVVGSSGRDVGEGSPSARPGFPGRRCCTGFGPEVRGPRVSTGVAVFCPFQSMLYISLVPRD